MAQSGYTPILIYASGTATNVPLAANMTSSSSGAELALNYADGKLYYKDSGGVVQVLATKGSGIVGGSNTQVQFNNSGALGGSANFTFVPSTGTLTLAGTATLSGTTSALAAILTNAAEICTVSATAATGTIAYYPSTQSVLYYTTSASANWTVNLTFSSGTTMNTAMSTGQSLTVAFLVTQGATAYYNTAVQVDGTTSGVTTIWQGGAPTKGNASGVDVYTYSIVKTGSATFTVFATQTQFK